jgi:hypothetical protein
MSLQRIARQLGVWCLIGAGVLVFTPKAPAGILGIFGCFDGCCCHERCPPAYIHCQEGPPKIKWKCGCPRPVCDPCNLAHFGYYRPCWLAWPYPPDWSHCYSPPPSELPPGNAPLIMSTRESDSGKGGGTQGAQKKFEDKP